MRVSPLREPHTERTAGVIYWHSLERKFGIALIVLLLGYAFLGKGFAYLHIPGGFPIYVGEIVLGLGLLAVALRQRVFRGALLSAPGVLYSLFFVLGVMRTIPHFGQHGMSAIRDAALYYYGLFMFLTYDLLCDRNRLERIATLYAKPAALYVLWVPIAFVAHNLANAVLPRVPGTNVPMLFYKAGDAAVHMTGVVAFFALAERNLPSGRARQRGPAWYVGAGVIVLLTLARAAYLSFASGLATLAVLAENRSKLWGPTLGFILLVVTMLVVNPKVTLPSGREFSLEIATGLVRGIFTDVQDTRFKAGSKEWRLAWWRSIFDETFVGPYFWTGRGFGQNLADAHGFQAAGPRDTWSLRSPHNSHVTVLARMGVPGFSLWTALHVALIWRFYGAWRRARRAADRFLQGVLAWVMCYWVAFVVNSTFDVYFEGPQGAIWLWSMMGLGLAAAEQAYAIRADNSG